MIKTIEERQTGVRTIAGTDWPVRDVVQRQTTLTTDGVLRVRWAVIRGLCNGAGSGSTVYRTRKDALIALRQG